MTDRTNIERFDGEIMINNTIRILQERTLLQRNPNDKFTNIKWEDSNIRLLTGTFHGLENTMYEGNSYEFEIRLSEKHPFRAPEVKFFGLIGHPVVDSNGIMDICYFESWRRTNTIRDVL